MGYYVARSRGGLGDAETEKDCPQPVSTAERDALREELGRYAGWGPGTYDQWHEGHPDLIVALDDIGGRMKGLYDRPKLLRCEKEARDRAQIWMGQLRDLLFKVKSAPNRGWDASGFTAVNAPFQWSLHRGPTYTIRSTQDPAVNCTMQKWGASVWGGAIPSNCQQLAPPGSTTSSAPPGTVVTGGQQLTTTPPPAPSAGSPPAQPIATVGGGGVWTPPAAYAPDFMAGELVPGLPNRYLVYGALGLLAWRMVKGR